MAAYLVDGSTALGRFLRRQGVQQWRIPRLIRCGGIRVVRGGSALANPTETTRLQDRDVVHVPDTLSPACDAAINRPQNDEFRDYAFAPGTTGFDRTMAQFLDNRPQTIRISDPLVATVAGFVRALSVSPAITNPVRHLILASHANPEGLLSLQLNVVMPNYVTYEDLEAAVQSNSIRVAPELLQPRPTIPGGAPEPPKLLIRGCRIGSTLPYLRKLKEAVGNHLTVIAPRHFHVVAQLTRPAGLVEYMAYSFQINRPQPFRDKRAAIREFQARRFTRIDGSRVPADAWGDWIPSNPNPAVDRATGRATISTRAAVVNPVHGRRDRALAEYRYRRRILLEQGGSMGLASDPGTEAARKRAVRDELRRQHARYRDTHPFPEYVRFGYATMDEFMDGWDWNFRYDRRNNTLHFNPTRHEYTVVRPITDPSTNRLILNFYPTGRRGRAMTLLDESDDRFFARV